MEYTKQTWTAPTGTGLSRYAKSGETDTHIELALDPVNLTNTPTPFTMARMAYMEEGIAKAYDTAPPTPWAQYSGKDITQLPDNVAGTTQKVTEFTSVPSGWVVNAGTPVSSFDDNEWQVVSNANSEGYIRAIPAGSIVIMYIKCISGFTQIYDSSIGANAKTYAASDKWNLFIYYVPTARNLIHYSNNGTYRIKSIYIGTGAYDRLVFDNSYHYRHLLNNAVIPTPQGLYFNGATSYLRSKDKVTLPDVFTFSATVNCAVIAANQVILKNVVSNNADGLINFYIGANSTNVTLTYYNTIEAGLKYVTVIANLLSVQNTDIKIEIEIDFINQVCKSYVNGALSKVTTVTNIKKPTEPNFLFIGAHNDTTSELLGYMRNICLFDTALTDTQRNWLAQGNTPPILYDVTNYELEGYVSIQDADGTNTGEETDVDSNGNRILKLPATIKATLSGNAGTATKLAAAREINGVSFDGSTDITVADATKAPIAHASAATTYGVSSEANYGHAKASTVAGSANGTASKGTTPAVFAQSNHVHPLQTSVSGNAGTADKWKTARNITISDADGTNTGTAVVVDGSENETLKLPATIKANVTGYAGSVSKANVRVSLRHGNTWFAKTWAGLTDSIGEDIWTDGENIYHSDTTNHFVLNKTTSTWTAKTWTGLTNFSGNRIWTDGDNIYHSFGTTHHVLNKATSTWTSKSWTGLTDFIGSRIWTDGENIYYSGSTTQYVLNKATSTWDAKVWTNLTNFNGNNIWTDGDNIYHSNSTEQFVLNKSTNTWVVKAWTGLTGFDARYIWTDGDNIYSSNGTAQYVLNKSTSTWVVKTWNGIPSFTGIYNWTDGDNIYSSDGTTQYVLPTTRHNYVDDDKYTSLFGTVTNCSCNTLSDSFVFGNE